MEGSAVWVVEQVFPWNFLINAKWFIEEKCGVIYNIKRKDCDAEDIGKTATKLGT